MAWTSSCPAADPSSRITRTFSRPSPKTRCRGTGRSRCGFPPPQGRHGGSCAGGSGERAKQRVGGAACGPGGRYAGRACRACCARCTTCSRTELAAGLLPRAAAAASSTFLSVCWSSPSRLIHARSSRAQPGPRRKAKAKLCGSTSSSRRGRSQSPGDRATPGRTSGVASKPTAKSKRSRRCSDCSAACRRPEHTVTDASSATVSSNGDSAMARSRWNHVLRRRCAGVGGLSC